MNVFRLREELIREYSDFVRSFLDIRDARIRDHVAQALDRGRLWPEPLLQLNPAFKPGETIERLVETGVLHPECSNIFRLGKQPGTERRGDVFRLHTHQAEAVKIARSGAHYVLTTGTGSGKSMAYIVPIVDHVLRRGSGRGIQAIVVYPMNALANSQAGELEKFLCYGYPEGKPPVTFARYTGQESDEEKEAIRSKPPDILLTNYVMLELLLTRAHEDSIIRAATGLKFLVLDELHTYRGRQGADVALLVRRARQAFSATEIQHVGTSATLAGPGSLQDQQREVAAVASLIFGAEVKPEHVVGETLQRLTPEIDDSKPSHREALRKAVVDVQTPVPVRFTDFIQHSLSSWIESVFGIRQEEQTGRLIRAEPKAITGPKGAADLLSQITGLTADQCRKALVRHLLESTKSEHNPATGFPAFAFRLHQFISRGDTVYASLEAPSERHITVFGQKFVPGSGQKKVLLPLVFCRECGQEYFCVSLEADEATRRIVPRDIGDTRPVGDETPGFLYLSEEDPWPEDEDQIRDRVPDEWIEVHRGAYRIRPDRREDLPQPIALSPAGLTAESGLRFHFFPAPFRFCLACGVSYSRTAYRRDMPKLATLATEGRSSATTILGFAAVRHLRRGKELSPEARKLLSFTDNRQDASLQAGHFNDFLEMGVLRSALYKAMVQAGAAGVEYDVLVQRVFDAMSLPLALYAVDPNVRFAALEDTKRAFKAVLAYRLYRDLKRGWRINSPNLEQCGLLEIRYKSLDDLIAAEDVWRERHAALAAASPETRKLVAKALLDHMRRELAIKVEAISLDYLEQLQRQSQAKLIDPWVIDDVRDLESSVVLVPRARLPADREPAVYLSPRGGFAQFLKRRELFPHLTKPLETTDCETIIRDLIGALLTAGLVEEVRPAQGSDDVAGYQLPASAMVWTASNGAAPFRDPIRVPRESKRGGRTNPYFVAFYKEMLGDYVGESAGKPVGLLASEHTAQVQSDERQRREKLFRSGELPILFCSPTMELGVDISTLNVVNMRNIPPTPANYSQRSGRAGRNGQPALVFSYCSTFSSHDQYFFARPELMVNGEVSPPRIEIANEDLVRSHVHAVWLAQSGQDLGSTPADILELTGEPPTLELIERLQVGVRDEVVGARARKRAEQILASIQPQLARADWYSATWLEDAIRKIPLQLDAACERWRNLYRSAMRQRDIMHRRAADHSLSPDDQKRAARLRAEAESQLRLLTQSQRAVEADFYSYRYFASEGFLPGYSFPRLPLSAFIPGRRARAARDEYLTRPRFLAISEFGPRAIIYHSGMRYRIIKAVLPARDDEGGELVTSQAKICAHCGYFHPVNGAHGADRCEHCNEELLNVWTSLFRMQNVVTKRQQKINCDEEERLRSGFEIRTGVRFSTINGTTSSNSARAIRGAECFARLQYGPTATITRINLGLRRRANPAQLGWVLDIDQGYWAQDQQDSEDDDPAPNAPRTRRVVPYVEDRKNCLLFQLETPVDAARMASLQAALKSAIQVQYQLEDSELAAEALPDDKTRNVILVYEAAEGGAGVLRHLVEDRDALGRVARLALELCHFDPETGEDRRRGPKAEEDCEAACYDCMMSYGNQRDHQLLNRHAIKPLLEALKACQVDTSPVAVSRSEHLEALKTRAGSNLEKRWLDFIDSKGCRLPSHAQKRFEEALTVPDFMYANDLAVIYIDGPPHDFPDRQGRDETRRTWMEDRGYTIIRFHHQDDWEKIIHEHRNIFGASPRN